MPKRKAQRIVGDGKPESSPSSSPSGSQFTGQHRYRALAPRVYPTSISPVSPDVSSNDPDVQKPTNKPRELTFVNLTDPSQSRSQETRKLVRTQVMRIFARERRLRETLEHTRKSPERPTQTSALASPQIICECPSPDIRPGRQHTSERHMICSTCRGSVLRSATSADISPLSPSSSAPEGAIPQLEWESEWLARQTAMPSGSCPSVEDLPWPIVMEPYMLSLINHVFSPSFRARESFYGLSLFSNRPDASQYPFDVDIESRDGSFGPLSSGSWTPWYALMMTSPALIHATLMIAASHISTTKGGDLENAALVAYHKDRALVYLHQLLEGCKDTFSDEVIAVAAVLACYELMYQDYNGFQSHMEGVRKLLEVRGGVAGLEPNGIILKIISWTDTMGAFLLSTRPYFPDLIKSPVLELADPFSPQRSSNQVPQPTDSSKLSHALHKGLVTNELYGTIRQTTSIVTTLSSASRSSQPIHLSALVSTRNLLIQRLVSIVGDPKTSPINECLRLTTLTHVISNLFTPALPPAYYRLISHALGNLTTTVEDTRINAWDGHAEILLWVHFVGFSAAGAAIAGYHRQQQRQEEDKGNEGSVDVDETYEQELRGWKDYFAKMIELMCCVLGIQSAQDVSEVLKREGLGLREGEESLEEMLVAVRRPQ